MCIRDRSMTGSNVPVFLSLSLALLKTSCCKGFVLSQPVNPGGECVRAVSYTHLFYMASHEAIRNASGFTAKKVVLSGNS